MEKRNADSRARMERRGSHATKGSARGELKIPHGIALVDDLSLVERHRRLMDEREQLEEEAQHLNRKLTGRSDSDEERRRLKERRAFIGRRMQHIQGLVAGLNGILKQTRRKEELAFHHTFFVVAKEYLPKSVFRELSDKANDLRDHVLSEEYEDLDLAPANEADDG